MYGVLKKKSKSMATIKEQNEVKRTAKQGERQLQAKCITWFRYQYPQFARLLISIPNGTRFTGSERTRAIMGKRFKEEGMLPGASDLFLFVPSGELHGLAIEMKMPKGVQSPNQHLFEAAIVEQGYGYVMPRSFEQFVAAVNMYLECGEY